MADETGVAEQSRYRFVHTMYDAAQRLRGADVTAIAAETAYYSMLAVAPFLIFLISGVAFISQFTQLTLVEDLESTLTRMAPGGTGELMSPLFDQSDERTDRGALSFGIAGSIVVSIWSGSRAINGLLKGFRRIRGISAEPAMIWNRVVGLFLAMVLGSVVILSTAVFLYGGAVGRAIASWAGMGGIFRIIWQIVSWPLMAGIVVLVLSLLYWFGGVTREGRPQLFSAGAIVSAMLWLVIMGGIRLYLSVIDVTSIYGALGSFVVLVVFFYIMSIVMLIGAAINAVLVDDSNELNDPVADGQS